MFVVTAIDRLRKPKDRERIVEVIRERIAEAVDARLKEQFAPGSEDFLRYRQQIGTPTVFPLSAYLALEAQKDKDDQLLEESQFTPFTSALEHFLTHTRGAIELQVLANRILATGDEIVKKINIEMGGLSMEQQEFQTRYEESLGQLEALRQRRDSELGKIDEAASRTWRRIEPMAGRIGEDLKRDALAVIDSAEITADDLSKEKLTALTDRLSAQVSGAVRLRGQRCGEALQLEIERDLQSELERLQNFAATVGTTLQGIEAQFGTVQVDGSSQPSVGFQSLAAAVSVFTGFGGIWSGYREAGLKGAALGGVASIGTYFVGGMIAAVLAIPISLPLIIGLGIVSVFTGGWAVKRVFHADRVERFTEQYPGGDPRAHRWRAPEARPPGVGAKERRRGVRRDQEQADRRGDGLDRTDAEHAGRSAESKGARRGDDRAQAPGAGGDAPGGSGRPRQSAAPLEPARGGCECLRRRRKTRSRP